MPTMSTFRNLQYESMHNGLAIYKNFFQLQDPATLNLYRDRGDGWTALQTLCHLRDFEAVFLLRVRLMVLHDNPDLPFPNPDQLAAEKSYHTQDLWTVYEEWVKNRQDLLKYLESLEEGDWERPGVHPIRGYFTPHNQLFLVPYHDTLHLDQITRTLQEKKA